MLPLLLATLAAAPSHVIDEQGLFDSTQVAALEAKLASVQSHQNVEVVVLTFDRPKRPAEVEAAMAALSPGSATKGKALYLGWISDSRTLVLKQFGGPMPDSELSRLRAVVEPLRATGEPAAAVQAATEEIARWFQAPWYSRGKLLPAGERVQEVVGGLLLGVGVILAGLRYLRSRRLHAELHEKYRAGDISRQTFRERNQRFHNEDPNQTLPQDADDRD